MYTQEWLADHLPVEGLGRALHFYSSVGSTNEEALRLARTGAAHGTLLVADEQISGRGRQGRSWSTPGGTAIAVTLIVRPENIHREPTEMLSAVGALGVAEGLERLGFEPSLKWPNDVLLDRRKVAGVLPEAVWKGASLEYAVLGIGVNVRSAAVPRTGLDYPATSLESAGGVGLDRGGILLEIMASVGRWLPTLGSPGLMEEYSRRLEFLDERVMLVGGGESIEGIFKGVGPNGELQLADDAGEIRSLSASAFSLRPVDRR